MFDEISDNEHEGFIDVKRRDLSTLSEEDWKPQDLEVDDMLLQKFQIPDGNPGYAGDASQTLLAPHQSSTSVPMLFRRSMLADDGSDPSNQKGLETLLYRRSNIFPEGEVKSKRMINQYPWLLPFGRGGPNEMRKTKIGFESLVRHYLRLSTRAFAHDHLFPLGAFDEISRRKGLRAAQTICSTPSSQELRYSVVEEKQVQALLEFEDRNKKLNQIGEKADFSKYKDRIGNARKMMRAVRSAETSMFGTEGESIQHRNQLWALWNEFGPPTFFITFNPNDVDSVQLLKMARFCHTIYSDLSSAATPLRKPCVYRHANK